MFITKRHIVHTTLAMSVIVVMVIYCSDGVYSV